ncbi:ion transporter [Luteimonas vadosa]|uniref:Ion transporter n=1 Tax=Luteimonas vadosa TaxID=1165507 RepID=A0ABP9DVN2_9GAMM
MSSSSKFLEPDYLPRKHDGWQARWFNIIFHHEQGPSKTFDLALIVAILLSVTVVILDSEPGLHASYASLFYVIEWGFTLLFTAEYAMRMYLVRQPLRYAKSFFGIIDLLSILPTYLSLLFVGSQYLLIVRVLRVLRVFRILKLVEYSSEAGILIGSLLRSRRKIMVFIYAVLTVVLIFGAVMFLIEGPDAGFTSIPIGMYWAIVTMATVGYGDIVPVTPIGRFLTSILVLIGYSIIAVPTGIYTAELASTLRPKRRSVRCVECGLIDHEADSWHCRRCGRGLPE